MDSGDGTVESPTSPRSQTKQQQGRAKDNRTNDKPAPRQPEARKHGPNESTKERTAAHAYDDLAAAFHERAKGVDAIMEKVRLDSLQPACMLIRC